MDTKVIDGLLSMGGFKSVQEVENNNFMLETISVSNLKNMGTCCGEVPNIALEKCISFLNEEEISEIHVISIIEDGRKNVQAAAIKFKSSRKAEQFENKIDKNGGSLRFDYRENGYCFYESE